jgi:uncharacterized membrane protein YebE (DUF533 family)
LNQQGRTSHRTQSKDLHKWHPGWRTKAIAAAAGGVMAVLSFGSPHGYAWGGSILSAGAALIVPAIAYRRFWNQGRFWITSALLAVLQVPLVFAMQP